MADAPWWQPAPVVPADETVTAAKITAGALTAADAAPDLSTQAELDAHTAATTGVHGAPGGAGLVDKANPQALTQTYPTASGVHANPLAAKPASTAATNVTPFGYTTAAQANAIKDAVINLVDDVANVKQFLNAIADILQTKGLAS